jgi:hypothetical protein
MLLIIAFALFALLIATWIAAPTVSTARRSEPKLPTGLPAMESPTA